ncbi:MAG: hypothetical protein KF819_18210 [Labilithrix sp.]|nr:hypothetical protein [Labilithrix sp.]
MGDMTGDPPRELLVDAAPAPGDSSDGSGSAMAPIVLTALVAGGAAKLVSPTAGLVCLFAAIALWLVVKKPDEGRFVLRVDGALVVTRERRAEPIARVALDDVLDVTLDRETRAGGRGGAPTERVRLAVERASGEPIFMPAERITPIEAQEWQGKVRVFLRAHGWLPRDERALRASAS